MPPTPTLRRDGFARKVHKSRHFLGQALNLPKKVMRLESEWFKA